MLYATLTKTQVRKSKSWRSEKKVCATTSSKFLEPHNRRNHELKAAMGNFIFVPQKIVKSKFIFELEIARNVKFDVIECYAATNGHVIERSWTICSEDRRKEILRCRCILEEEQVPALTIIPATEGDNRLFATNQIFTT